MCIFTHAFFGLTILSNLNDDKNATLQIKNGCHRLISMTSVKMIFKDKFQMHEIMIHLHILESFKYNRLSSSFSLSVRDIKSIILIIAIIIKVIFATTTEMNIYLNSSLFFNKVYKSNDKTV